MSMARMELSQIQGLMKLAAVALLTGCSSIVADDDGVTRERRPAIIHYHSDSIFSLAPTEVTAGQSFAVSVRSYVFRCAVQGPTFSYVNGLTARIEAFDRFPVREREEEECSRGVGFALHAASITFAERGTATILFHGRREPGSVPVTGMMHVLVK